MKTQTRSTRWIWYASLTLFLMAGAVVSYAEEQTEKRLSTTTQGQGMQRGGVGAGAVSNDEFDALITQGQRTTTSRVAGQQKLSVNGSQAANLDFWIFSADVDLYADIDRDGFFSGVDLAFDADTIFAAADVYAVLYLSYELGPWNEYASTADFTIFGASAGDEYVIDTELVSGYLTGDYDILIELFDAVDGTFLTSFGPDESSALSFLPLEDAGRDTPPGTTVVVSQGGGGAASWMLLLGLLASVGLRRSRIR